MLKKYIGRPLTRSYIDAINCKIASCGQFSLIELGKDLSSEETSGGIATREVLWMTAVVDPSHQTWGKPRRYLCGLWNILYVWGVSGGNKSQLQTSVRFEATRLIGTSGQTSGGACHATLASYGKMVKIVDYLVTLSRSRERILS